MKKFICSLSPILIMAGMASAQVHSDSSDFFKERHTVIAGVEYRAGALHRFFWGSHWRDVWTMPVQVGVLDLDKFAAGLTPIKKGGGLQTKSLKLKGNDGNTYKFRSLNKDPRKALAKLAPGLEESAVYDIMKDQISSGNPYAPLVVSPLLDAEGILHSRPLLATMPKDEKLGEFKNEFGGLLGMLEKQPEEMDTSGADKVKETVKLLDHIDEEFDETVNGKSFLKARLMDALIADWDRHKDNWTWLRFNSGGKKVWEPWPEDRDQAFSKFEGFLPFIFASVLPQLNHFGYSIPLAKFMTWTGRYLDQRFITFLTRREWDSVTNDVYAKLTDAVIENAVNQFPPEVLRISRNEVLGKLKSRRNELKEFSNDFYELVNWVVDIYTTNKKDYVEINFPRDGGTEVSVYKRNKSTGSREGEPLRHKIFDNNLTSEFRIYLQDGDDKVTINGKSDNAPLFRIIGGEGQDELVDNSDAKVIVYDDGKKTRIKEGENTSWDDEKWKEPKDSLKKYIGKHEKTLTKEKKKELEDQLGNLKYDPLTIDRGSLWAFYPYFTYTPDVGPLFGAGVIMYNYYFRVLPYASKYDLTLGYAPDRKNISGLLVDFKGLYYNIAKHSLFTLHMRKSGIEVTNYFGQGNETVRIDSLDKSGYYKVQDEEYRINPSIEYPANTPFSVLLGAIVKNFKVSLKDNTLMNSARPYGTQELALLGIQGGFTLDRRDNIRAPYSGYYLEARGTYYPKVFNNHYQFGRVHGDLRGYIYTKSFTDISLGVRVAGEKVWGTYPFFESAFIGGIRTVRGYLKNRFAGDASVYAGAELRMKLFDMTFLIPETIGLIGFGETGRVFLEGEDSKLWHAGYGGGVYIYFLRRDLSFSISIARSAEKKTYIYFNSGFGF